jgi:colanic acid/amylovoran biosynthesis glycosyltransferase
MSKHIAYLVNQYPMVSHSFIRREIHALERIGFTVRRVAVRGWAEPLVDPQDQLERTRTRYLLHDGLFPLLTSLVRTMVLSPVQFADSLRLALNCARVSDKSLFHHVGYLAEACLLLKWTKEWGVKHVHAHFGTNGAQVAMLANCLGGPSFSFTVHGPEEFDKPQALALGEKVKRAAFVAAISSFGRSQIFRWVAHEQWAKVSVVHCGLEQAFHGGETKSAPSSASMVCIGRLCEQKGQLLLIEAAHLLKQRGVEFNLVLAGDGEMRKAVESAIARYNLNDQVRITGWISSAQVREELLAARAMVLPSFAEGLPVVIMEAMSMRRPVLSTFVAGIPELVQPGETGWLVPAGDVQLLADAMQICLQTPTEVLARMGRAASLRVVERHNIDTEATKLSILFKQANSAVNESKVQ